MSIPGAPPPLGAKVWYSRFAWKFCNHVISLVTFSTNQWYFIFFHSLLSLPLLSAFISPYICLFFSLCILQPDQINMTVLFWYLVKRDANVRMLLYSKTRPDKRGRVVLVPCKKWPVSVGYCTLVHWTSHFLQGTINTRLCITVHPVAYTVQVTFN